MRSPLSPLQYDRREQWHTIRDGRHRALHVTAPPAHQPPRRPLRSPTAPATRKGTCRPLAERRHAPPTDGPRAREYQRRYSRLHGLRGEPAGDRHYSSLPCRRVAETSAASEATGRRPNSAACSPPPRATGWSPATARTWADWITSATSGTLTTPTRSSSAAVASSRGGAASFPSVRWPKSGDGRERLCWAAPAGPANAPSWCDCESRSPTSLLHAPCRFP